MDSQLVFALKREDDPFHGGKEQGMAEYARLQMMADINHDLREHQTGPDGKPVGPRAYHRQD